MSREWTLFGLPGDSGSKSLTCKRFQAPASWDLNFRMHVTVNGESRELPTGATVRTLIESLGLAGKACAAEVNAELVPFRKHTETELKDGDRIEIVTLVGGG